MKVVELNATLRSLSAVMISSSRVSLGGSDTKSGDVLSELASSVAHCV